MACRVPVIGSDSGAIPEVIGDPSTGSPLPSVGDFTGQAAGLIFPEGDAVTLADCLRQLMTSPTLCADLSERGYARATTHYSQEVIAARTAEFYRGLMGKARCTGRPGAGP
jgi:glycosyltransferase involved in cell wall biosynthesis